MFIFYLQLTFCIIELRKYLIFKKYLSFLDQILVLQKKVEEINNLQSQSAKTIFGFFPPSSSVTRFRLLSPAALWISFPTL